MVSPWQWDRVQLAHVREMKALSMEAAIRKMTSDPAARLGLHERGVIAAGKKADIIIFDPNQISDQSTFENPHRFSTGIEHLYVNGQAVLTPDGATSNRPGKVLSR
jgi:N-acyl-D-aspartate/D-glutamate deacylase